MILDDIRLVGQTKLLGYLPIITIEQSEACVQDLMQEAQDKGLECFLFSEIIANVASGALFVADMEGLQLFLSKEKSILDKYGWSIDAREFVEQVATQYAEPYDLFELVALVFGDKRPKYQHRSAIEEVNSLRSNKII